MDLRSFFRPKDLNGSRSKKKGSCKSLVYWHTSSHVVDDYYLPTSVENTFEASLQFKYYEFPVIYARQGRRLDAYFDVRRAISNT